MERRAAGGAGLSRTAIDPQRGLVASPLTLRATVVAERRAPVLDALPQDIHDGDRQSLPSR